MRCGYDAAYPVVATWALEFAPVNTSVLFVQTNGNEHFVIASRSWFFEELARCLAEIREVFPWRVAEHLIPPEPTEALVWESLFKSQRLLNVKHAPRLPDGQRMLLTQQFLSRLNIDTVSRAWDEAGNNALLVDSLNGYRVKELSSHPDVFTMNVLGTHEQYLTRALEHYAANEWANPLSDEWAPAPDWSKHDRAVIAGGRR